MTDRYDELRAAAEAATPGARWTDDRRGLSANRGGGALQIMAAHRGEGSLCCIATVNPWERPEANAAFIALANPEAIRALLHALAEANERASLLQKEREEANRHLNFHREECARLNDTIFALEARRGELEGALKPFSHDPKSVLDMDYPDDKPLSGLYNDWNFHPFPTFGDFRRVRSLLNPQQEGRRDHG